ncbi:MAG: 5-formyltetrahydrofolate cyclo-ligase [Gammaproteobacteria bacterium]|nr:5-formyltetrahydrofolate cyclo-ligase [Gammaproteobacteria bacterium]
MKASKAALRGQLRGKRRALGGREYAALSRAAQRAILRMPQFRAGARVAVYLPIDRETDTALLRAAARRRGVRLFVPVIADMRRRRIEFHPFAGRMRRGAYGISIPHEADHPVGARWLDLVVVPLVGIDAGGRRLGMGGGFYDRAFAYRACRRHWSGPCLIGLGFDFQRVDAVFAEPWDLRLDGFASETGIIRYPRRPQ